MQRIIVSFLSLLIACPLSAATKYFAQSSAGGNTGVDCADAIALSGVTWTAGNTYHLCGTVTSQVSPAVSGTNGNLITIIFESGASISKAGCGTTGCINLNGLSYFLIDGSPSATPCGVVSGTAVFCSGTISATGTGSGQSSSDSVGIYARGGGSNIEIRNLNIANMYVISSNTDTSATGNYYGVWTDATSIHVHNCIIHDTFGAIKGEAGNNTSEYDHSQIYNSNWGIALSGPSGATPVINAIKIHDNDFHDWELWDTTTNTYHHDGVIAAGNNNSANAVTNISVYNNRFHGTISNGTTCAVASNSCMTAMIFMNDGNHFSAYNNVIIPDPGGGLVNNGWIFFWSPGTLNANDLIADNTVVGNQTTAGACIVVEGDASMTWQNNVSQNCNLLARVYTSPATSFTAFTNNAYQNASLSNSWQLGATTYSTLGTWQAALVAASLPGDTSSQAMTSSLNLNSTGQQYLGSALIGAGVNLTSLSIPALDSDFLGNSRPGGSTAWDIGAYFGVGTSPFPLKASPILLGFVTY